MAQRQPPPPTTPSWAKPATATSVFANNPFVQSDLRAQSAQSHASTARGPNVYQTTGTSSVSARPKPDQPTAVSNVNPNTGSNPPSKPSRTVRPSTPLTTPTPPSEPPSRPSARPPPRSASPAPPPADKPFYVSYPFSDFKPPSQVDLSLSTGWFTHTPPTLPPSLHGRSAYHSYHSSRSRKGTQTTNELILAFQWKPNLATSHFKITWINDDISTAKAEQRHKPPPTPPTPFQLTTFATQYGNAVATWCEARIGTTVGNGECWTLAHDALRACNAMPSLGYTHGACILSVSTTSESSTLSVSGDMRLVARGDILQFTEAVFKSPKGYTVTMGTPVHTAVVVRVLPPSSGGGAGCTVVWEVVEQNTGLEVGVVRSVVRMEEIRSGVVLVYRAVDPSWGKVEAKW
ncbi:uncharacterized protein EV422DRAFT_206117 [Fimicolochytrium jonesii]|uniref:uncharacterized protein n=1 Tax=Fimicolochytrium jonesii TaxID=1396493 RepID=UPI0022FDC184|nr:uncharacterized protein EV422DRAFT_206117 [Fimicolochytrium jonesii]KAI8817800.1 hypothetical protein EV422DRAFT_206117 [Fimicolochytrium jonesii]